MSQIPSEYRIPEGAYNPNSQNASESLIAISSEISSGSEVFESQTRESQIALARREMGEKAVFGSRPEHNIDPMIVRIYYLTQKIHDARRDYLRAA